MASPPGLREVLTRRDISVHRFRLSHATTLSVPLSESAQRMTTDSSEKGSEVRVEVVSPPVAVVHEDEPFEWREVIRGRFYFALCTACRLTFYTGIFDIQVWLSAIAYLGIIVPLYSFSLFL